MVPEYVIKFTKKESFRECGSCTMCCTLTSIPELAKPERVTCEHVCNNKCSIYEQRPGSCRSFECAWLQGDVHLMMRPDICHIMIEKLPSVKTVLALVEDGYPNAWQEPNAVRMLNDYLKQGYGVVVGTGKMKHVLAPYGRTTQDIENDLQIAAKEMGVI